MDGLRNHGGLSHDPGQKASLSESCVKAGQAAPGALSSPLGGLSVKGLMGAGDQGKVCFMQGSSCI